MNIANTVNEPEGLPYPDTFVEPGSGLKMEIYLNYVLSESGSSYFGYGFASLEVARKLMEIEWPGEVLNVPVYDFAEGEWKGGLEGASFVSAKALWDFWVKCSEEEVGEPSTLEQCNPLLAAQVARYKEAFSLKTGLQTPQNG